VSLSTAEKGQRFANLFWRVTLTRNARLVRFAIVGLSPAAPPGESGFRKLYIYRYRATGCCLSRIVQF
jgi:hypothetical protein